MCNRLSFLVSVVALVAAIVITTPPAVAQYAPTENPAKAAGLKPADKEAIAAAQKNAVKALEQARAVKDDLKAAEEKAAYEAAKKTTADKKKASDWGNWAKFVLLCGVVGFLAAVIIWLFVRVVRWLRGGEGEGGDDNLNPPANPPANTPPAANPPANLNPHAPPAPPAGGAGAPRILTGIAMVVGLSLFAVHPLSAGQCFVVAVGNTRGNAKMPVMVEAAKNTVRVLTDAATIQIKEGEKSFPISGINKVAGGFEFIFSPTRATVLKVMNGQTSICSLYVTDAYGAYTASIAVESVRGDIEHVGQSAASAVDKLATINDRLEKRVEGYEGRITALEQSGGIDINDLTPTQLSALRDKLVSAGLATKGDVRATMDATGALAGAVAELGNTVVVDRGGLLGRTRKTTLAGQVAVSAEFIRGCVKQLQADGSLGTGCEAVFPNRDTPAPATSGRAPMQPEK